MFFSGGKSHPNRKWISVKIITSKIGSTCYSKFYNEGWRGDWLHAYVNLKEVCTVRFFGPAEHWLIKTFIFSILDVAV
jgi:hypothetical protein